MLIRDIYDTFSNFDGIIRFNNPFLPTEVLLHEVTPTFLVSVVQLKAHKNIDYFTMSKTQTKLSFDIVS